MTTTYTWTEEQMDMVNKYYSHLPNLARINQYLEDRETIFKSPNGMIIRCIKSQKANFLHSNLKHYEILKHGFNIYHSIATYTNFPLFSWNPVLRKEQYQSWTNEERYKNLINGYDFYMDFDNKGDYRQTHQELIAVSEYFMKKKIKHSVIFSGSGFHLKSKLAKPNQNPEYCKAICERLIKSFRLESVDKSIYRWQGIIKTPYTIDFKTMRICTPLNIHDLESFNFHDTELENNIDFELIDK